MRYFLNIAVKLLSSVLSSMQSTSHCLVLWDSNCMAGVEDAYGWGGGWDSQLTSQLE